MLPPVPKNRAPYSIAAAVIPMFSMCKRMGDWPRNASKNNEVVGVINHARFTVAENALALVMIGANGGWVEDVKP